MNYTIVKKLRSLKEIIHDLPLPPELAQQVAADRAEIKDILAGRDPRLLIVLGPCSAWPQSAIVDYAKKLAAVNEHVKQQLKLVMRVYIQKPRTTTGWTGPANQPDPFTPPDIEAGIHYSRKMMLDVLKVGLPIADEALFIHNADAFLELLSWVAIGARSSEDQEHRIFASAIDCPVGLKNPTNGSVLIGVNGAVAAQQPHVTVLNNHEVQTHGNQYAHVVLRGGDGKPNYSLAHLREAKGYIDAYGIKNPAIMIDVSHDNCFVNGKKDAAKQPQIIYDILDSVADKPELKTLIKGFMLESYLQDGCQKLEAHTAENINTAGLSITDPCLGWEHTEKLLLTLAARHQS